MKRTIERIKAEIQKNIDCLDLQLTTERDVHIIAWCKSRKAAYEQTLDIIAYETKMAAYYVKH